LRVSELIGLNMADLVLHPQPTVHVMGKGRRERVLPLWKETTIALRDWLRVRGEPRTTALFLNARGDFLTRSGFEYILEKHLRTGSATQPSLARKGISPHSLRHYAGFRTIPGGDSRDRWNARQHWGSARVVLRFARNSLVIGS
jgi:site-specific recombinase XerD